MTKKNGDLVLKNAALTTRFDNPVKQDQDQQQDKSSSNESTLKELQEAKDIIRRLRSMNDMHLQQLGRNTMELSEKDLENEELEKENDALIEKFIEVSKPIEWSR